MRKTLKHTLTGTDAAAAMIMDEVYDIFFKTRSNVQPKDDWRLEMYITGVMVSNACKNWEVEREKIEAIVKASHNEYDRPKKEWDTAFRRLTRRGFLYSKRGNRVPFEPSRGKVTRYGLRLDRYDTDKVVA